MKEVLEKKSYGRVDKVKDLEKTYFNPPKLEIAKKKFERKKKKREKDRKTSVLSSMRDSAGETKEGGKRKTRKKRKTKRRKRKKRKTKRKKRRKTRRKRRKKRTRKKRGGNFKEGDKVTPNSVYKNQFGVEQARAGQEWTIEKMVDGNVFLIRILSNSRRGLVEDINNPKLEVDIWNFEAQWQLLAEYNQKKVEKAIAGSLGLLVEKDHPDSKKAMSEKTESGIEMTQYKKTSGGRKTRKKRKRKRKKRKTRRRRKTRKKRGGDHPCKENEISIDWNDIANNNALEENDIVDLIKIENDVEFQRFPVKIIRIKLGGGVDDDGVWGVDVEPQFQAPNAFISSNKLMNDYRFCKKRPQAGGNSLV
jgi:hypothetical protein